MLYIAMRKYGVENFYIEVLHEQQENESLDELEIRFIQQWNCVSPHGYNMTNGGSKFKDDNPMYHDDVRQKVSTYFIGDKNPAKRPEVKEKIRQKALGRKMSDEAREKMRQNNGRYWLGKRLSDETRAKISQNHARMYGGDNPWSKRVQRLDKDTLEVIDEYDSIATALRWIHDNVNPRASGSNISHVCHGKQKTAFGFKWKLV